MITFRSVRQRQTVFLRVRAGGMSRDCKPDAALSALVRLVVAGLAFAAWQDAGERHGCHRVKALTRLLRSRRGPASGRLTTVGRRLPAIFGRAGRNTEPVRRTGGAIVDLARLVRGLRLPSPGTPWARDPCRWPLARAAWFPNTRPKYPTRQCPRCNQFVRQSTVALDEGHSIS